MKSFYYLLFFFFSFSIFAKSPQSGVTPTEIYVWGSIFFSLSMGSLLLIVYLIPRKKNLDTIPKQEPFQEPYDTDTSSAELPTTSLSDSFPKLEIKNPKQEKEPVYEQKSDSSPTCNLVSFDSVYNMRLMDVENICKEFIERLYSSEVTGIYFYFIKSGKFTVYLERKNNQFIEYHQQKERSDLHPEIIKFLNKKLGAFSSSQLDAVLPLVSENQLFGAIKIQISVPMKNSEINHIWREIKSFSKMFFDTYFKMGELVEEEDPKGSTDNFQNLLSKSFSSASPRGLCLVKWIQGRNSELFYSQLTRKLNKFTNHENTVHKLNDNMFGFILSDTSLETVQDSIGIFMGELIQDDPSLEFCIGCSTVSKTHGNFNDWYKSALQSLKTAVSQGVNKFNFIN